MGAAKSPTTGYRASAIERSETAAWIEQGLSVLDDRCRELIVALYLDPHGSSYAEVAEQLRMPLGSVGPTRGRCLERLREAMESLGKEDETGSGARLSPALSGLDDSAGNQQSS